MFAVSGVRTDGRTANEGGLQDIEIRSAIGLRALFYVASARWRSFLLQAKQRGVH
jgi:hypothetical protein